MEGAMIKKLLKRLRSLAESLAASIEQFFSQMAEADKELSTVNLTEPCLACGGKIGRIINALGLKIDYGEMNFIFPPIPPMLICQQCGRQITQTDNSGSKTGTSIFQTLLIIGLAGSIAGLKKSGQ